jgi:hypothetical protein
MDEFRHSQQMDILTNYSSTLSLAQSLIDPEQLILHPDEVFQILYQMIKKKVLCEVALWLFMHKKVPMSRCNEKGEFQSLWPSWAKATRETDDAGRVLMVAQLDILPFECWWIVANCLTGTGLGEYFKWKDMCLRKWT